VRTLFFAKGTANETRALLADLCSELELDLFTVEELCFLLRKNLRDRKLGPALCRHAGERKAYGALPVLYEELVEEKQLPLSVMCAVVDTLGQIGNEDSLEVLDRFKNARATKWKNEQPGVVSDIAEKAGEEILRRITPREPASARGQVLVQCAFYGDVARPGQAGGGGLATLLDTLGASLARTGKWERVYTFLLFHLPEGSTDTRLVESSGDARHLLVRVPVDFRPHNQAHHFLAHEYEIMRAVKRTVEMHDISPDVFHIRYSDNASRAVMRLARLLGKTLVFTLTPDPHRNLSDRMGMIRQMDTENVLMNVNKVEIADELVEHANGIALIGHGNKNDQIIPYFPALWLDEKIRERPVRIIAEGIDMNMKASGEGEEKTCRLLLRDHGGRFALSNEAYRGPLILNVGRLNPLKGQHVLVEAWASSEISTVFNLVIVGGNLRNPDSTERSVLDRIEGIVDGSARLKGRFCHIGAIPNRDVRMLERNIAKARETGLPPVYVCASLKEEFGISILEAMSEGFLIFAPESGGVSSYVRHGQNGFLIDTHSVASIKEGLEKILLSKNFSHKELYRIAERGKTFSKKTFSIDRMAAELTDFYRDLEKGGQG
jgi:glycosyltransferase involved in cell wall biosynthesis